MSACYRSYRISAYRLPHGEAIGVVLLDTPALFAAEFAERQQLGLTGHAAVKHFNDWMERGKMPRFESGIIL